MFLLVSLISSLLLSTSQLNAQPTFTFRHNGLTDDHIKSLRYVSELIYFPARSSIAWQQLKVLSPRGPEFIDRVLDMMVDDHLKWTEGKESKDLLFSLLLKATHDPRGFKNFAANPIRRQIHGKATWLLDRFAEDPARRERVAELFDSLGLWGREELPFLTERYRDGEWNRFAFAMLSAAGQASPDELNGFAEVVRELRMQAAHVPSRAFAYSLIYRHGKLPAAEYSEFLRFLIERDLAGDYSLLKEIGVRDSDMLAALMRDTFYDIQYKLAHGDSAWTPVFLTLEKAPSWAGKNLSASEVQKVRDFLRWIRTNDFNDDCPHLLTAAPAA